MSKIYTSADQLIGHTPLLELTHIENAENLEAKILAKLEYFTHISHELLTPLTTISCVADDLEENEEVIAPIYEAALSMKPDYDVEKIYELLEKNKKLA